MSVSVEQSTMQSSLSDSTKVTENMENPKKVEEKTPFYIPDDDKCCKDKNKEDNKEVLPPENGKDLKMSRGLRPDADIDWEKLRTLFVMDEQGNKIRFTDIFKKQKTIVIFIRVFIFLNLLLSM